MRVLVIGLNWLGDVIMSLPAIKSATEAHEIHILTRPKLAGIYKFALPACKVHSLNNQLISGKSLFAIKALRKIYFDQIIVLPDSFRSALTAAICNSNKKTGYSGQHRNFLLTDAISKPEDFIKRHESVLHFNLFKETGLANHISEIASIQFSNKKTASTFARFPVDRPYFLFAPGAAFGAAKKWPPERFAQLAVLIHEHYKCRILITCSDSEKEAARIICRECAGAISLAGQTSLEELAILVANAQALVANDSGTMHLGALFNSLTFVPVGPTDMVRTGSLSDRAHYIYAPEKCDLAPCRQKTCPLKHHKCMNLISAQMVFDKIKQEITFNP